MKTIYTTLAVLALSSPLAAQVLNVDAQGVSVDGRMSANHISTTNGNVNINGDNGNVLLRGGVLNVNGNAMIEPNGNIRTVGSTTTNTLTAYNGARVGGGLDVTNSKITRLAAGTAPMDAVNKAQLDNSAVNTRAAAFAYTDARIATTTTAANDYTDLSVGSERDRAMAVEAMLGQEISQVGAMSMAAAAVAGASHGTGNTSISAAFGFYGGETAIAAGLSHQLDNNVRLFGTVSAVTGGNVGAALGAGFSF